MTESTVDVTRMGVPMSPKSSSTARMLKSGDLRAPSVGLDRPLLALWKLAFASIGSAALRVSLGGGFNGRGYLTVEGRDAFHVSRIAVSVRKIDCCAASALESSASVAVALLKKTFQAGRSSMGTGGGARTRFGDRDRPPE